MSLRFLPSVTNSPKEGVLLSGSWIEDIEANPAHLLTVKFQHTDRQAPVIIECNGSTKASAMAAEGPNLLEHTKQGDKNDCITFSGSEYFWNNELRKRVIAEGLDKFVPQILYLVRPETAYISCLHFLAKELGGMTRHEDQRNFIF